MKQEHEFSPAAEPAVGFSYQIDLGGGRQMVFQSHVPQSASGRDMALLLKEIRFAVDAELKAARIEQLRADAEQAEVMIGNAQANMAHLDKQHAAALRSQSQRGQAASKAEEAKTQQERANAETTLARAIEIRDGKLKQIRQLEGELDALYRITDRDAGAADS